MRAKKSLGQHFLRSERALNSIVDAGEIAPYEIILEIGPGEGALTEKLLRVSGKVIAVEKDDNFYKNLETRFTKEITEGKLDLIHGDILDFNANLIKFYKNHGYKLIANIPYNITGAIFKKFLETDRQPERIVLLVQKEVAKRIVAQDNKESILSISVKAYGAPTYIETVKAGSFVPMPKVDSAIILIDDISKKYFTHFPEKDFFEIVRAGFKSKRKKLSSNLSAIFAKDKIREVFEKLNLDDNLRAEDVGIETWEKLATYLFVITY